MWAIEQCRGAALGGHVLRCEACGTDQVSYNSCRNRHCPKCQSNAAKRWLDARQADLLPVEYYHMVFTLPAPIADIAYQNKAAIYGCPFAIAAEVLAGLCQAAVRSTGGRAGLPVALHAPRCDLQQPSRCHGRAPRELPLEGLPRQGPHSPQDDDAGARGVHAPIPAARTAQWLP